MRAKALASLKKTTGRPVTSIQSKMNGGEDDDVNRIPTVAEMKEKMNAVTSQRPSTTRSTKPENMTKPDGTPKLWFHEDHCWYCDAKGHDRQSCDKYKKLLAANGGRRPAGYEGAFEKAQRHTGQSTARAIPLAQAEILTPANGPQDPRPARVEIEVATNPRGM